MTCTGGQVNAGSTRRSRSRARPRVRGPIAQNTSVVDPDNTIDEGVLGDTTRRRELEQHVEHGHDRRIADPAAAARRRSRSTRSVRPGRSPASVIQYTTHGTNGNVGRADYITMTDGTQGLQAASITVTSSDRVERYRRRAVRSVRPTVTCTDDAALDQRHDGHQIRRAWSSRRRVRRSSTMPRSTRTSEHRLHGH